MWGQTLRTWGPRAKWGRLRRRKLGALEDLAAQNPAPAKRNPRPNFGVSCPDDGPRFGGTWGGWMVLETSGTWVIVPSVRARKVGGRQRIRLKNEQLCKSYCASRSNFKSQALVPVE